MKTEERYQHIVTGKVYRVTRLEDGMVQLEGISGPTLWKPLKHLENREVWRKMP